jgi:hypothetical protein
VYDPGYVKNPSSSVSSEAVESCDRFLVPGQVMFHMHLSQINALHFNIHIHEIVAMNIQLRRGILKIPGNICE